MSKSLKYYQHSANLSELGYFKENKRRTANRTDALQNQLSIFSIKSDPEEAKRYRPFLILLKTNERQNLLFEGFVDNILGFWT